MADGVKDELSKLVEFYESSAEASQESRAMAERDRDYYDHKQLSAEVLAELKKRKQPPTIVNYVQKNVNYLLGLERQNRTDPKAYPRTPIHEDAANAASDAIRYVCDENQFDFVSSECYENIIIEGYCGCVIEAVPTNLDEFKITMKRVSWDRIFTDPHSSEKDFSDDRYRGYIKWMDVEEAETLGRRYGYNGGFSEESGDHGQSYEDKPNYKMWYDAKRKRVKISFIWFIENGVWHHAIYSKAGIIWGPKPSAYLDDEGNPECNFIIQSVFVDRENNRYGYVRSQISQQDAINKRESKSLHLLSQRQTWAKEGAFKDINKAKRELAKPDGHIEVTPNSEMGRDFGILSTGDLVQGQFMLLQEAKRDIDTVGSSGTLAGASGSASGRALEARAESGNTELSPLTDAHKQFKVRAYRCLWNKIRQFWDKEKWIRVTDDEKNLKWVGLNTPISIAEQMIAEQTGEDEATIKMKYVNELEQAIQQNPALAEIAEVKNEVAELDIDIIIEEVPNVINFQNEQFIQIARLAERRGDIPTPLLIKMSSLRNKEQILSEMLGDENQKAQEADARAQANEIQQRLANAEVVKTEQEAEQISIKNELMRGGVNI